MIKWIKSEIDGRIGIVVPYNELFNRALKQAVSSVRFKEDRRTDGWFFDEEAKPDVLPLLEKFYANPKWVRVEWDLDSDDNITVDGAQLILINRDWWQFYRAFDYPFRVVDESLQTGGSRRRPDVSGRLAVDLCVREGAEFYPEPTSIMPVDNPADRPAPNPLAIYSDDMLAAELARRSATTAAMLDDADLLAELQRREIALYNFNAILDAMKIALGEMWPNADGKIPEEEKGTARELHRFVKLTKQTLTETAVTPS